MPNMLNQAMLPVLANEAGADGADGPTRDYRRLATLVGTFQLAMLGLFLKFASYPSSFAVSDDVQYAFYLNGASCLVP